MASAQKRSTLDIGLLALRVGVGGTLFAHGTQKLFGWFGGHGLDATAGAFDGMGFKPAKPSAAVAGISEAGGALIAIGAATPVAAAGAVGAMIGAASVHKPAGFFATAGGYEYPATLGLAAAALALTGPGKYSVDAALGHRLNTSRVAIGALAAAGAGAGYVVARRQKALAQASAAADSTETA
ncbi:DoxX family protein [Williamsia muralis]|jgi:putative oxidoreductase|uniref:Putative oxidoreductase n=1 Tax=Williamsia marianensis TaxID=85044 RepID=A0A495K625_WILMA|nr:DoxX family protein [Williamsia muralis]RKR96753.1 putative oxidoreductase [Williamsia muralis]